MSRYSYLFRGCLYVVLAVLPVVKDGIVNHTAHALVVLTATYEAALAIRAFVDRSSGDHKATVDAEAEAKSDNSDASANNPAA